MNLGFTGNKFGTKKLNSMKFIVHIFQYFLDPGYMKDGMFKYSNEMHGVAEFIHPRGGDLVHYRQYEQT
jgi:hypothetical protein